MYMYIILNVGYACVHLYVFYMYKYIEAEVYDHAYTNVRLNVCAAYGARSEIIIMSFNCLKTQEVEMQLDSATL